MVTKFQIFVENILDEFIYKLKNLEIKYDQLTYVMLLNSLRISSDDFILKKRLECIDKYDVDLYKKIEEHLNILKGHYSSNRIGDAFKIKTKFPLGKTGKKDMISLFRQIDGINIFESVAKFDINEIDSLFLKRHLIVHQDKCDQLTEKDVLDHQDFLKATGKFIDRYLEKNKSLQKENK